MVHQADPIRVHIQHGFNGLTIEIPAPKQWFTIAFLCFWLAGWLIGEVLVGSMLLNPGDKDAIPRGFLMAWLAIWTFGGLRTALEVIWLLTGREVVTVSHQNIVIARQAPGWTRRKEYNIRDIRQLHITEPDERASWSGQKARARKYLCSGRICFEYQHRSISFGEGLSDDEASRVMDELKKSPHLSEEHFARIYDPTSATN